MAKTKTKKATNPEGLVEVVLTQCISGPLGSYVTGQTASVPLYVAQDWQRAGFIVSGSVVPIKKQKETAKVSAAETTSK